MAVYSYEYTMPPTSTKKNILLLITKGEIGGAQMSVINLARYLKQQAYSVTLGFGKGDFLIEKANQENIPYFHPKHLIRTQNILKNILFIFEIKKYCTNNKVDILHLNSTNTLFAAIGASLSKQKPKIIFTFRGLSLLDPLYTSSKIKRITYRLFFLFLLRFVDEQVYVSEENLQFAKRIKIAKNAHVIANAVNISKSDILPQDIARKKLSDMLNQDVRNTFIIGSIGRLAYQKNYEFLIEQMIELHNQIPNIRCIIIGDGPQKNKLQKLVASKQLTHCVLFTNSLVDAYQFLSAFDMFVLPSRYEGMSITLLEAMTAGLPILASDVQGNHDIVSHAGELFVFNNSTQFQEKTLNIIQNKAYRKELSQKALIESKKFSMEHTGEQYIHLYEAHSPIK
ncbi:MAG: glycosyltransferase family 4 protein [Candidatus Magasanikbacteria bacterium]|nr:glycosyltransferase family 4 protein [Candidatus Magasanikbacteria bacterium]